MDDGHASGARAVPRLEDVGWARAAELTARCKAAAGAPTTRAVAAGAVAIAITASVAAGSLDAGVPRVDKSWQLVWERVRVW